MRAFLTREFFVRCGSRTGGGGDATLGYGHAPATQPPHAPHAHAPPTRANKSEGPALAQRELQVRKALQTRALTRSRRPDDSSCRRRRKSGGCLWLRSGGGAWRGAGGRGRLTTHIFPSSPKRRRERQQSSGQRAPPSAQAWVRAGSAAREQSLQSSHSRAVTPESSDSREQWLAGGPHVSVAAVVIPVVVPPVILAPPTRTSGRSRPGSASPCRWSGRGCALSRLSSRRS